MSVAAIIPTYQHFDYAEKAAESFLEHTPNSSVIIVDDGSPEWDSYRWPKSKNITLYHFPQNATNLSRSWNRGLEMAHAAGTSYAVVTNSDVLFTPGWWLPIQRALTRAHLVGPLTNAPGHRLKQGIRNYRTFDLRDDRGYLSRTALALQQRFGKQIWRAKGLNGFCLAAKMETWWDLRLPSGGIFDARRFPMGRNEDELQGRLRRQGKVMAIAPASFVLHYRGVSRGTVKGTQGRGWFRSKEDKA